MEKQQQQQQQSGSFKIFFGDEIRRVGMSSPPPSFAEFRALLRSIFGARFHPELSVQYEDEDHDKITVASDIEWSEALRSLAAQPVKRIFISSGRRQFFKDAPPPRPLYFYEEKDPSSASSSSSSPCRFAQKEDCPKPKCIKACGPHQPVHCRNPHRHQQRSLDLLKQAVPACLERLFDGGKILPHHLPDWLTGAVRVNVVVDSQQQPQDEEIVDLDVDVDRLQCLLHRRALAQFDRKEYGDACNVLQALLLLDPNSPLALYNLACAEALVGDAEAACTHLAASVANGYHNLEHLKRDTDLDSLRQLPAYLAIVRDLEQKREQHKNHAHPFHHQREHQHVPVKVQAPAKQQENEQQEEKKEEPEKKEDEEKKLQEDKKQEDDKQPAPVPAPAPAPAPAPSASNAGQERFKNELQLLADMGFDDAEKNLVLLAAVNGDLASAISLLFNMAH